MTDPLQSPKTTLKAATSRLKPLENQHSSAHLRWLFPLPSDRSQPNHDAIEFLSGPPNTPTTRQTSSIKTMTNTRNLIGSPRTLHTIIFLDQPRMSNGTLPRLTTTKKRNSLQEQDKSESVYLQSGAPLEPNTTTLHTSRTSYPPTYTAATATIHASWPSLPGCTLYRWILTYLLHQMILFFVSFVSVWQTSRPNQKPRKFTPFPLLQSLSSF